MLFDLFEHCLTISKLPLIGKCATIIHVFERTFLQGIEKIERKPKSDALRCGDMGDIARSAETLTRLAREQLFYSRSTNSESSALHCS